jgi:hypothetical protein
MARTDINDYANGLLLDFLDAFHVQLRSDLEGLYGERWLEEGVQRPLDKDYFPRARDMLESPMRVVDMGKADEELYGVEHLWNVVEANWKPLYAERFGDRVRTQAYLSEVAELRHNVSHRRKRHYLRRSELARFTQNCAALLRALGSPEAARFEQVAESLTAGGTPWGDPLVGYLPPHDEVVEEFVGRTDQLRDLNEWLASDVPQLLVWGYGGAGKSALAYEFAQETKEIAPNALTAVCWVSAKSLEYVEGAERSRRADFFDRPSLVSAIFTAMYEGDVAQEDLSEEELLSQLKDMPILLVVDDFDTLVEDEELAEFLIHDVRRTQARVLYTSRQNVTGIRSIEVLGFEKEELEGFVRVRAFEHGLEPEPCAQRVEAIKSVTGGFPLFVDDLLRYAKLTGIKVALEDWSQRKGDAAREYALRRQLENLGAASSDVLIGLSVSDRPLTTLELATVAGMTDDDTEHAVKALLNWRLINRVSNADENRPGFAMNLNTRRLVQRTYRSEPRMEGYQAKLKALRSARAPAGRAAAVASAIGIARSLVIRGDVHAAVALLRERMTGELSESAELYGALGWVYSRLPGEFRDEARQAFEKAYELGNTMEDTYFHWASMERDHAEEIFRKVPDSELLDAWRACARIAERGMKVVGHTRALCQLAGYAHSREAKTLEHLNEFMQAHGAYAEAAQLLKRALTAPVSAVKDVPREVIYRGLALAYEGTGDEAALAKVLTDWAEVAGNDDAFTREYARLTQRFPHLVEVGQVAEAN